MNIRYFKEYSSFLNRDMEFKMYGHAGTLCLVLPCQDGRFFEWEDRHMYDQVSDLIEQGRIQFVSVDSVDLESWSSYGDSPSRMQMQENYVQYIMNELIPSALYKAGKPQDEAMMVMGASMGAFHAGNFFFRYPGRFKQVLALSGLYDMSRYFYDGNIDFNAYQNNPCGYLSQMDPAHPYIPQYNEAQAIFVVGQGAWEHECADDLRKLADLCFHKGIHIQTDFWGFDVPHDWPSWERQIKEYLPRMC
ncbi:esterase family protein [Dubosiella newyorkensis]|uniref:esterase family protein n=1 Tax=Dubosiella newyorkensis TaxID=1862672 RepID=UPI00248C7E57|nr:alpha/beta hydrolase-fold protein [Dubosiella newyorkensis]